MRYNNYKYQLTSTNFFPSSYISLPYIVNCCMGLNIRHNDSAISTGADGRVHGASHGLHAVTPSITFGDTTESESNTVVCFRNRPPQVDYIAHIFILMILSTICWLQFQPSVPSSNNYRYSVTMAPLPSELRQLRVTFSDSSTKTESGFFTPPPGVDGTDEGSGNKRPRNGKQDQAISSHYTEGEKRSVLRIWPNRPHCRKWGPETTVSRSETSNKVRDSDSTYWGTASMLGASGNIGFRAILLYWFLNFKFYLDLELNIHRSNTPRFDFWGFCM